MSTHFNIYMVDDNDIDIAVNSKLLDLARLNATVRTFGSAQRFTADLEADPEKYKVGTNILLLDIMMPGMNGFEFLDKFEEMPPAITSTFHVFMLSSSIDRNDIRRAEKSRFVRRVLEKPLDVYLLKQLLSNLDQYQ